MIHFTELLVACRLFFRSQALTYSPAPTHKQHLDALVKLDTDATGDGVGDILAQRDGVSQWSILLPLRVAH